MLIEVTTRSQRLAVTVENIVYAGRVKAIAPNKQPTWCIRCIGCYVLEVDFELDWSFFETLKWERLELTDNCFAYCNPQHLVWRELDPETEGFVKARFADASYLYCRHVPVITCRSDAPTPT